MKILRLLLTALFVVAVLSPQVAADRNSSDAWYGELSAQYLSLRNTDTELIRAPEWIHLANQFRDFVRNHPRHKDAPAALYRSAILNEKLFNRFGGEDRIRRACSALEQLAQGYPGNSLVDDALLLRGDLLLKQLGDYDGARRSYQEVVDAYPKSDMYGVAKVRLKQLLEGPAEGVGQEEVEEELAVGQKRKPLIVIDPGHGGEDFGATGKGNLLEKDVVLAVALELERILVNELDVLVRLTRRRDVFVPLADRTNLANDFEADLFISLHVNASPHGKASGFETYYLDNTGDKASKKLAERENASLRYEDNPVQDISFILSDLIQSAKLDDSIVLAHLMQKSMINHLKPNWKISKNLGVKKAPFYVLVGAHMPCALVEMFFINNKQDYKNLVKPEFRKQMARGLARGVQEFLSRSPS